MGSNGSAAQEPRPQREDRAWANRRVRIAASAAGLAAVLGVGAYVITDNLADGDTVTSTGVPAAQPPISGSATAGGVSPSGSLSATSSTSPSPAPSLAPDVAATIAETRRKMAEDGVPVQRPATPRKTVTAAASIMRDTVGSLKEGGIVRIVSARGDLTGQSELAWVAGGVAKHRNVDCSQTFKFATSPKPARKPNLLLCWRTSARK